VDELMKPRSQSKNSVMKSFGQPSELLQEQKNPAQNRVMDHQRDLSRERMYNNDQNPVIHLSNQRYIIENHNSNPQPVNNFDTGDSESLPFTTKHHTR